MTYDVAIVGGGPAGSTIASLLLKYRPGIKVVVFEQAKFPRDHVGESQLPPVCNVLDEIGAWDKVEAAGFPVKVGATYKWGQTDDLWYFNFVPDGHLEDVPRPSRYEGQRSSTAFQVDRAVYDKILLDHARELGADVREETKVYQFVTEGDRVLGLKVEGFEDLVEAKYYVDASGGESPLRKTLDIPTDYPTSLRNIAIWDYWQNAEWAEHIGVGGTRVQVMSIGWGWLWFIPLSPTRTSLGLVTPAEHYRKSGLGTQDLYLKAISEEPRIRELVKNATREELLSATKDWNFVCHRLAGANWFLAGDACGFADPILAAGLTLAQMGARRVAFSILEQENGRYDPQWVRDAYTEVHTKNIRNHIRFADYWYSANAHFTELKEYCTQIAGDAGLDLTPDQAFQWLGTGGFTSDLVGMPFASTFSVTAVKDFIRQCSGDDGGWKIAGLNTFRRREEGVTDGVFPMYAKGEVVQVPCKVMGERKLPLRLVFKYVWNALADESEAEFLLERFLYEARRDVAGLPVQAVPELCIDALEAMVTEGWVEGSCSGPAKKVGELVGAGSGHP